jgi:XTP/dITP diphosphohydrolase
MIKIILITSNKMKFLVAKNAVKGLPVELEQLKLETPELQDMNVCEVAKFSARWAADKLQKPVIKSDQGFYIEALNGFPGAYMHDVEATIGKEGFKRIMTGIKNRKAKYVETLAFCKPGEEPIIFTGEKHGALSENFEGEEGYGVDFLFIPSGEKHTASTLPEEKMIKLYDFGLWPKMIEYLKKESNKK